MVVFKSVARSFAALILLKFVTEVKQSVTLSITADNGSIRIRLRVRQWIPRMIECKFQLNYTPVFSARQKDTVVT